MCAYFCQETSSSRCISLPFIFMSLCLSPGGTVSCTRAGCVSGFAHQSARNIGQWDDESWDHKEPELPLVINTGETKLARGCGMLHRGVTAHGLNVLEI